MPHRTGLAGKTATRHGARHVELTLAVRCNERLLNEHAQNRASKIGFHRTIVDDDLASAHFDPHPRHGVLALARGVSAALLVELLNIFWRLWRRGRLERRQLFECLNRLG